MNGWAHERIHGWRTIPADRALTCVATSFGSAGDLLPTLAIAAALRRRGHDIRFVANPSYESQVRRAGRPIDGMPFAYDQFTLSEYVERLGVGRRLRIKRRARADLVAMLGAVLGDVPMARRAAELGARFDAARDGAETAADVIERRIASASFLHDFR